MARGAWIWPCNWVPIFDTRSLALFRIVLGATLLCDLLAFRVANLEGFFTDAGIIPRDLAREIGNADTYTSLVPISPLFLNGSHWFVALFFSLSIAAYVSLLLGWHARIAAVASLVCLMSIQHRASIVIETDDRLLASILFWAIFLPLDCHLAVRKTRARVPTRIACLGLLIQIVLLYFCNGFSKIGSTWSTGVAINYAMMEDLWIRRATASWLAQNEALTQIATLAVRPGELMIALLLVFPACWQHSKAIASVMILALHWIIWVFLTFGFLPLIASSYALAIVPGAVFDRCGWRRPEEIRSRTARRRRFAFVRDALLGVALFLAAIQSLSRIPQASPLLRASGAERVIASPQPQENPMNLGRVIQQQISSILRSELFRTSLTSQNWLLYAPDANSEVGWIYVRGVLTHGTEIELRSREPWVEDASLVEHYQVECWQNFIQYQLYREAYSERVAESWLRWEVERAINDGIDLEFAEIVRFDKRITGVQRFEGPVQSVVTSVVMQAHPWRPLRSKPPVRLPPG